MRFTAQQAVGPTVEAVLLLNSRPFSPRYDLDRSSGTFSRTSHPLHGESLRGKILASRDVEGGVAGGWAFLAMRGAGVGPAGLVFGGINPVMVQGAVTAGLPVLAGVDSSFFSTAKTGDTVRLDPRGRCVEIVARA